MRNTLKYCTLWLVLAIALAPATSIGAQKLNLLKVFTTAGLDKPLSELANSYTEKTGVKIEIISGTIVGKWLKRAQSSGDIIICGAEYQFNQLISSNPGLIDVASRTSLGPRVTGILVRKGNTKKIATFSDLGTPNMKLMVVDAADQVGLWEDMVAKRETIAKIQGNIVISAKSNAEAVKQWNSRKDLDAWITFQSWHYYLQDTTRQIKVLDHYKRFRGTPIAITKSSKNKELAKEFIEYLKSKQNLQTFQKWGW